MKTKITAAHPHFVVEEHTSHLFVADYTNQTQSERAVVISSVQPDDIHSFPIKNPNQIPVGTVIFDKWSFVSDKGSESQCECMAFAHADAAIHPWVLLLELKYCKRKNAKSKIVEGTKQLQNTLVLLKAADIISSKQRCYLIVSLPDPSNKPYDAWGISQEEKTELAKQNIYFKASDKIVIASERILEYEE